MSKTIDHLEAYEWLGEFWPADAESQRFPGVLRYSPTDGLTLTTMHRSWVSNDRGARRVVIHGVTVDTGPVTLFAAWSDNLKSVGGGQFSASEQRFVCTAAILGAYYSLSSAFSSCKVEFNNVAEFFQRQGFKNSATYTRDPILSGSFVQNSDGDEGQSAFDIRVEISATGFSFRRASDLLLIDEFAESELARDINSAVDAVLQRYEKGPIFSRGSLDHVVCIDSQDHSGRDFLVYDRVIRDVQGLFCLLFLKLVRPLRLTIKPQWDRIDQPAPIHSVLISLWLSADQVGEMRQDKTQFAGLPIRRSALDGAFNEVLHCWFDFVSWSLNIVYPTILARLSGPGDKLQRYILSIASIEQCVVKELGDHSINSLRIFLDRYSTEALQEKFLEYLPPAASAEDIPRCLYDIRNCIVHPAKAKKNAVKWIEIVNSTALPNLSELIHLVLVSYVYERIGLSLESVHEFRDSITQQLTVFEKID